MLTTSELIHENTFTWTCTHPNTWNTAVKLHWLTANAVCMLFVRIERFSVACYGMLFCFVELVWSLAENYCEMSRSSLWWTKMADKCVELDKEKWASLVSRYKFLYNRRWFQCSVFRFSSISNYIMYHWHAAYLKHILVKTTQITNQNWLVYQLNHDSWDNILSGLTW